MKGAVSFTMAWLTRVAAGMLLLSLLIPADAASLRVDLLPEKGRARVVRESDGAVVAETASNGMTSRKSPEGVVLTRDNADRLVGVAAADVEFVFQYDSAGRVALVCENDEVFRDIEYAQTPRGLQVDVWHSRRGGTSYLYSRESVVILKQPLHGGGVTTTTVNRVTGQCMTEEPDGTQILLEPEDDLWRFVSWGGGRDALSATLSSNGRILDAVSGPRRFRVVNEGALASVLPGELAGRVTVVQNATGRPCKVYRGGRVAANYGYDADGRLSRITLPGGPTYRITCDSVGRFAAYEAPGGEVTRFTFEDDNSRLVIDRPVSGRIESSFDGLGRLIRLLGPGDRELVIDRGADGRSVTVTQRGFDVQREEWIEDRHHVFTTYESERFGSWFFLYPKHDDTVTRIDPSGGMVFYRYSDAAELLRVEDGDSKELASYTRDAGGRVVLARTPSTCIARSYDGSGRLTKETEQNSGFRMSYAYNDAGLLSTIRDSAGHLVGYDYDDQHRVTGVESSVFGTFRIRYGKYGLVERIDRPNGIHTVLSYSGAGRLSGYEIVATGNEKGILSRTVRTDAEGNYVTKGDGAHAVRFLIDKQMHRGGEEAGGKRHVTKYDAWGNVLQGWKRAIEYEEPGIPKRVNEHAVACGDGGRISRLAGLELDYDWNGRLTRMKGTTGNSSEWTYDALGRLDRCRNLSAGKAADVRYFFVRDQPYAVLDVETRRTRRYLFVPGFEPCFAQSDFNGKTEYPICDGGNLFLFTSTAEGAPIVRNPDIPAEGESAYSGGLCFLKGDFVYRDGRFFYVPLNRALSPVAPSPFESAVHFENPVAFGSERPVKTPCQEVNLP